jgi:hypothetical protein
MNRVRSLIGLGVLLVLATPALGGAKLAEGNWKLSFTNVSTYREFTYWLIKVETKDDKVSGTQVATQLQGSEVQSFTLKDRNLRVVIKFSGGEMTFEGQTTPKNNKKVLGTLGNENFLYPAEMTATDMTALEKTDVVQLLKVPPMQKALALNQKAARLRLQARNAKDPEQKAQLLKDADEANKAVKKEVPGLLEEVLSKHADSPVVFEAALGLLRSAEKNKATEEQVKTWASTATKLAKPYGPRWQLQINRQIAEVLANQEGQAKIALDYAQQAEKQLPADAPASLQVSVLKTLRQAQRKAGQEDEAKSTAKRIDKIEDVLDKEYLAKVPPFKGKAFEGRKGKSTRVVLMELFTGAQCPPCVAADVAFDVLQKTYKPSELVLLQYHLHIPGPDPMTNADSEARAKYYGKQSTPSTFFNGKEGASNGGPMAFAEKKYDAYRAIIDPQLEEDAGATIKATATRQGDKIDIKAEVRGLKSTGENTRLRMVLVEETIRYTGGNGLRFHHQVVRTFPGGVKGTALTEKDSKHTATVDLAELRKQLTAYLKDYEENQQPFPNSDRPLDFNNLRVVVFVQDDDSREVLQAAQIEVGGEKNGK